MSADLRMKVTRRAGAWRVDAVVWSALDGAFVPIASTVRDASLSRACDFAREQVLSAIAHGPLDGPGWVAPSELAELVGQGRG